MYLTLNVTLPPCHPVTLSFSICAAPEVLLKKDYTRSVDVWGIGVVVYMMLSNQRPFDTVDDIITGQPPGLISAVWAPISDDAKELIRQVLHHTPDKRPSVEEVLRHPWCQTYERDKTAYKIKSFHRRTLSGKIKTLL